MKICFIAPSCPCFVQVCKFKSLRPSPVLMLMFGSCRWMTASRLSFLHTMSLRAKLPVGMTRSPTLPSSSHEVILMKSLQIRTSHRHIWPAIFTLLLVLAVNCWRIVSGESSSEGVLQGNGVGQLNSPAQDGPVRENVLEVQNAETKTSTEDQPCWMTESYVPQGPCHACDEQSMKYASYCCSETGFRQLVRCQMSNSRVYKSCPKTKWAIEKSFWTFEGVMLAVGMSSFVVVIFRRRSLDWDALQRVRKQIANSV